MPRTETPAGLPIERPTLILDGPRARANIEAMARKAAESGVVFRPHFKTHQSAEVGRWFQQAGVNRITVSSVDMAEYFTAIGFNDITIAFSVNLRQLDRIDDLARRISLGLLIENAEAIYALGQRLTAPAAAWLKVDVGYGRTGLDWRAVDRVAGLAAMINRSEKLGLAGLLTHDGRTYKAGSAEEIQAIHREGVERLGRLRRELEERGSGELLLSVGDTPACKAVERFEGVDEVRPGNFVFHDLMQLDLGAAEEAEVGVALACPVVATHPDRNLAVIYGGAVHLSKESRPGPAVEAGRPVFGRVAWPTETGWGPLLEGVYVVGLTQEHGLVSLPPETLAKISVGDVLMVIPVHSCLTADCMGGYLTLEGEELPMLRTLV